VGESAVMRAVRKRVLQVAPSMAPVLVLGESGTGKELVARAVHACSHRHAGPFVPVNCGAIPDNLLEAEFFGSLKGSYTGATQDRAGFFQAAAGSALPVVAAAAAGVEADAGACSAERTTLRNCLRSTGLVR